jgi:hypothetical protein
MTTAILEEKPRFSPKIIQIQRAKAQWKDESEELAQLINLLLYLART